MQLLEQKDLVSQKYNPLPLRAFSGSLSPEVGRLPPPTVLPRILALCIWLEHLARSHSSDFVQGPSSSEAMKLLADQGAASFDKVAECYSGPEQRLGERFMMFPQSFRDSRSF